MELVNRSEIRNTMLKIHDSTLSELGLNADLWENSTKIKGVRTMRLRLIVLNPEWRKQNPGQEDPWASPTPEQHKLWREMVISYFGSWLKKAKLYKGDRWAGEYYSTKIRKFNASLEEFNIVTFYYRSGT